MSTKIRCIRARASSSGLHAALLLAFAVGACAGNGAALRPDSGDGDAVARGLAAAKPAPPGPLHVSGHPFVYLVIDQRDGARLVAYDVLRAQVAWAVTADVVMRVVPGRQVVVHSDQTGSVIGRDSTTGAVVWRWPLPAGQTLVGYDVDAEDNVVVTIKTAADAARPEGAMVGIEGRRGSVRFRTPLPVTVGAPALRGGVAAVPNQSQYVTFFDAQRGSYLAEVISREEEAAFVEGLPEGFVFGSRGLFLAGKETARGARRSGGYVTAKLPEFVRVVYHADAYRPEQGAYSAIDRNRLLWRLAGTDAHASFAQGLVVVHNFRFMFGMDAQGALRWVYTHPREDMIGSAHAGRSIVFATADGAVGALDPRDGRRLALTKVPFPGSGPAIVRGASFDVEGYAPAPGSPGAMNTTMTLAEALTGVILDPDKRFLDVKVFALTELLAQPGAEVTADLMKILERSDQLVISERATEALVKRQDASALDLFVAAVRHHPDYADDVAPPRLDVLARALGGLKAQKAVPDLIDHLRLPDTDPSVVRDIATVAITTGARDSVEAFRDYLLQYRADPAFINEPGPLLAAAEVLLRLGGPSDRELLLFVAEDPRSLSALRTSVRRALTETSGGPDLMPGVQ